MMDGTLDAVDAASEESRDTSGSVGVATETGAVTVSTWIESTPLFTTSATTSRVAGRGRRTCSISETNRTGW